MTFKLKILQRVTVIEELMYEIYNVKFRVYVY